MKLHSYRSQTTNVNLITPIAFKPLSGKIFVWKMGDCLSEKPLDFCLKRKDRFACFLIINIVDFPNPQFWI